MPAFNPVSPQLQEVIQMASTDIRSVLNALETVTTQTATNATEIAAQGVTLAQTVAQAVIEKTFSLQKIAFTLQNGVYIASILHELNSRAPGVTIYDNDGDLQLAEFIAVDEDNAKVELTASQWNDGSFPFTVNLQAKMGTSSETAAGGIVELSGFGLKYRYNPLVFNGCIESAPILSDEWGQVPFATNVSEAHVSNDGLKMYLTYRDSGKFESNLPIISWGNTPDTESDYATSRVNGYILA